MLRFSPPVQVWDVVDVVISHEDDSCSSVLAVDKLRVLEKILVLKSNLD